MRAGSLQWAGAALLVLVSLAFFALRATTSPDLPFISQRPDEGLDGRFTHVRQRIYRLPPQRWAFAPQLVDQGVCFHSRRQVRNEHADHTKQKTRYENAPLLAVPREEA